MRKIDLNAYGRGWAHALVQADNDIYICTRSVGTSLAGVSVNNDSVAECVVKL